MTEPTVTVKGTKRVSWDEWYEMLRELPTFDPDARALKTLYEE